jgi:glycine dehydrogenase subunit 1
MLSTIGASSMEELFESIPAEFRLDAWEVPDGVSEMAVRDELARLSRKNDEGLVGFLGGGFYDHYIPAAVDALSMRQEFYTAYTPYQPECAQGTLQSIYEYQSSIARLTEMEFVNASLYEGGTAAFEAVTMAMRITKRSRVVCHESLNPIYREQLVTHISNLDLDFAEGGDPEGAACVIVQNPSFLGSLADYTDLAERCHEAGALLIVSFYPISLGLVKTPGEMNADIAIAEGQSLGIPLGFGGPYLGVMATRKKHVRKMPGRIAAATEDAEGRRGFVLTLQAREQHIRRAKAMSNICSNQALCALRALIYLTLMGKEGLREVATQCHAKAEYLKFKLGFADVLNSAPTFNEFVLRLPKSAEEAVRGMASRGFEAGLPLASVGAGGDNDLLVAVTERRTREQLDAYALALEEVSCS